MIVTGTLLSTRRVLHHVTGLNQQVAERIEATVDVGVCDQDIRVNGLGITQIRYLMRFFEQATSRPSHSVTVRDSMPHAYRTSMAAVIRKALRKKARK
jgi:hypothetical protein